MSILRKLHGEEEGISPMQVLMVLSIAAVLLLLVKLFWSPIKNWLLLNLAQVIPFDT